ncbi:hypothetical protein TYRP_000498 [Tyrophagus putrescentiae]|nr:hypothetical protein TYRP_000498 [Tyrophagus putrescentiae]
MDSTPDQASNVDRKIRAGTAKCCLRSRSIPLNTFECNRMLVTQSEPNTVNSHGLNCAHVGKLSSAQLSLGLVCSSCALV